MEEWGQSFVLQQQACEFPAVFRFVVGRIGQDNIETLATIRGIQKRKHLLFSNRSTHLRAQEVLLNRLRGCAILFHKDGRCRAATERLDSERTTPRKKVEH